MRAASLASSFGEVMFSTKAGAVVPRGSSSTTTSTRPTSRSWPGPSPRAAIHIAAAPLLAHLREGEKIAANTGKIVYNCLPPDEWGEALPIRASFRHGYPTEIMGRVRRRWSEHGFT
jgi:4-hydroxy-3-polyprenylbenzoate decarboxylase